MGYAEVQTHGKFSAVWIQFNENSNILKFTYSNCHSFFFFFQIAILNKQTSFICKFQIEH